jgi:tRNA 2-thiouridine synthesizing protein A
MKIIDARGKLCPQPIIDIALALRDSSPGEIIQLLSDDPATWPDLQAWARMTQHLVKQCDYETFEITV